MDKTQQIEEPEEENPSKPITPPEPAKELTKEEKKEQERTTAKKQMFLKEWGATLMSIKETCRRVGIDRWTYRDWTRKDPAFVRALQEAWQDKLEDVEEKLNKKILEDDGTSIRYFLDRRHPLFKPRVKLEGPQPGERTAEQDLDEFFGTNDNEDNETQQGQKQPGVHPAEIQDQGQARPDGGVQAEPGPGLLLGETNPPQPGTESPAEGDQQNN